MSRRQEIRRALENAERKYPTTLISNHSTYPIDRGGCGCAMCDDRVQLFKDDPEYSEEYEKFKLEVANGHFKY